MADGIDHLVVAVADLDAAADELERAVGLVCTGGGRHEGLGTANRLAFLADGSYVELMAVEDAGDATSWPIGVATLRALKRGGGLAAYGLLDDQLPITVAGLRAAGSGVGPVTRGSRALPDGELVNWWTSVPEPMGAPKGLPFLIRHAMSGAEWGPAALAARATIPHPAGSPVHLLRLDLPAPDPLGLAALHFRQLGMEFTAIGDRAVAAIGHHVVRLVPDAPNTPPTVALRVNGSPRTVKAFRMTWELSR